MSQPESFIKLSETLGLSKYPDISGHKGYWLYDSTRGMNLSMRAKTERDAFVEALTYYQKRLSAVEQDYKDVKEKVEKFVNQFATPADDGD
jgi:hypothetical protein